MKSIHRNKKKQILFLFVLMFLVFNLNFKIQKKPEQTVNESHEVTVRLVLVDVIAADKDGNLITDLTIDDFEIYEEGKKVPINSLDLLNYELSGLKIEKPVEEKEQITPSPQIKRKNKFFVIFDSINTVRRMLNRSKASILEKLIDLVRAGGEIMVLELTEKGEAQILQPLTSDEELIAQAIHKASGSIWVEKATDDLMVHKIIKEELENKELTMDFYFLSSKALYEYNNRIRFEKTLNAFLSVMNMIKDYHDRKPVLLVSSGFPSLSFERYAEAPGRIESTVGHADLQAAKINDPFMVLGEGKNRFEDDIFENLIQFANTHNITFYTMDPDTYLRYIFSDMAFDNYYKFANPADIKQDELFKLKIISEDTGGETLQGANKYDKFQKILVRDLSSYYELSYYPARKKADGKYHKIEVKVKRPGIKLRFRQGYYDYTDEQQESLLFASASANPDLFKEISFQARAVPFISDKDKVNLWINMAFPVKDLILTGDSNKEFKLIKANFWLDDGQGASAFNAQLNIPINLSGSLRERYKKAEYYGFNTCSEEIKLKSEEYRIIFTVYDEESSRTGTVEQIMAVPEITKETELNIATTVFGRMIDTKESGRSFSLSQNDGTLQIDKYKFYPMGTNEFNAGENIFVFLQIHPENDKAELIPAFELLKEGVSLKNLSWDLVKESWDKKPQIWNKVFKLDFSGCLPGEYNLKLIFTNSQNQKSIKKEIKLKLL